VERLTAAEFATLMAPLGPFERHPLLAVAVSGGPDSLSLCILAHQYARERGGAVLGLIVDHGLRPESAAEAAQTLAKLYRRGIAARILTLAGLAHGPGLAARARAARYAALESACAEAGALHLLLGHHAADQAETVAMRLLAGSGPDGLAAMPALAETAQMRLLRPLLTVAPVRLRATLAVLGETWVDDSSNADPAAQRARLRALRRDRDGIGPATRAAVAAAAARGAARAQLERATAALLARRVRIAPAGFAVLAPGALPAVALAALLRTNSGAAFAPAPAQVARLAAAPRAATLGGVRLLPAGRRERHGWLLVREAAAVAPPQDAAAPGRWDGRFRTISVGALPEGASIGALGSEQPRLRGRPDWPEALLKCLPALRLRGKLAAAPHLGYADGCAGASWRVLFEPTAALAAAPFLATRVGTAHGGGACGSGGGVAQPGYKRGDAR